MMATVKVRKKGQVTIPENIREVMGIREGDILVIDVQEVMKSED